MKKSLKDASLASLGLVLASRALIKNRLDESSNLAHRGMHAKFQLIWMISLVRAMGRVEN